MEEEKFLTSGQAAKLLDIHQDTLRNWDKLGKLKPHHISSAGYKYYSEEQILQFKNSGKNILHNNVKVRNSRIRLKTKEKNTKREQPLFKLYFDSGLGQALVNCYSTRSAKTNSLAYANNPKLFSRVTETIAGQEVLSENDEYKFDEPMHGVTITLGSKYLDNLSTTITKGVMWIQMMFSERLHCSHPSDKIIEEARYMKWKIDDYMSFCGLSDRKTATENMRKTLSALSQAIIEWKEEIIVRDDNGKPIYIGNYRDKNGKVIPKVKKSLQTYRGAFISTHGLKPIHGGFEFWINKEFATYLAHAGVIAVHENFFRLDAQKSAPSLTLAVKLLEYYSINRGTTQSNVLSVKSLLKAMPIIPAYETLTSQQIVTKSNGDKVTYKKMGNKGGWTNRIKKPFETAFNTLVENGILKSWNYRDNFDIFTYEDFVSQNVCFEFDFKTGDNS